MLPIRTEKKIVAEKRETMTILTKDALITFSASVEGRNITRAMSPMGKGLQSWLCAYPSNTTNTIEGEPVGEGNYITSSPGVLTGIQSYKMYLSNDIYSFYAVSCNSSNPAPTFTNGKSEALSNGVDYLWWHALHQDVTSSQVNIPITYQHVATQVVITITGGENITLNKVLSATITPTKPGAFMDLSTGIISSEVSYDKPADMGINDFTVQYIMLPLKSSDPMANDGTDGQRRKFLTYLQYDHYPARQYSGCRKFISFPCSNQRKLRIIR